MSTLKRSRSPETVIPSTPTKKLKAEPEPDKPLLLTPPPSPPRSVKAESVPSFVPKSEEELKDAWRSWCYQYAWNKQTHQYQKKLGQLELHKCDAQYYFGLEQEETFTLPYLEFNTKYPNYPRGRAYDVSDLIKLTIRKNAALISGNEDALLPPGDPSETAMFNEEFEKLDEQVVGRWRSSEVVLDGNAVLVWVRQPGLFVVHQRTFRDLSLLGYYRTVLPKADARIRRMK